MQTWKIGLAQLAPRLGDVAANLEQHLEWIERARAEGVDLLCFPELSLTGYILRDLVPDVALPLTADHPTFAALLEASRSLDLLVGLVEEGPRHRFFNAAAYLGQGKVVHVHRKVYLPTYTLFEEGRYWAPGDRIRAFDTRLGRFGILVCEDFWHLSAPYLLWLDGADFLLLQSASPGRGLGHDAKLDSTRLVEGAAQTYASFLVSYVIHCNRVGFEDEVNFWGGSAVYDPDGNLVVQAPYYDEGLVTASLDRGALRRARIRLPLLRDEKAWLTSRELQRLQAEEAA
jgi:NAD+ synthase (glutamine-hydrolysing)